MAKRTPAIRYNNIMIDLETLGLTADSVILSIGAVKFNPTGAICDEAFYTVVDIDDQRDRHINGSTLAWWVKQGESAQKVFDAPKKSSLDAALEDLQAFVDHAEYSVWSNGADFDIPMINHALRTRGYGPLFKHWNHKCFRTLKGLYPNVPKPPFEGTQHNALMDAIHQAKWAQALLTAK